MTPDAFHAGEARLQTLAGMRERLAELGTRVIRDHMPDQHRELFEKLPWMVVGSVDGEGRPWASVVIGHPGFVRTPDARSMRLAAWPGHGDPLAAALRPGAPLGLLGIQLETKRRNRMNGRVRRVDDGGFEVEVVQSFGNCPQYIHVREPHFVAPPEAYRSPRPIDAQGPHLSSRALEIVGGADTLFIASASSAQPGAPGAPAHDGVDVSHRGGAPGFVRVDQEAQGAVLTMPDYRGNFFFNTLGNLLEYPRAGMLFVDFERGDLLALTGRAEVVLEGAELARFEGALRLVRLHVEAGRLDRGGLPLRWRVPGG